MPFCLSALTATPRLALLAIAMVTLTACGASTGMSVSSRGQDASATVEAPSAEEAQQNLAYAVATAKSMRARGQRVWCVPFARNASGIDIRGNAKEWWGKAKGIYGRGHEPQVGAVMAFSATRKNPLGHVAVVSDVVSEREIKIDHANWSRNKVSLGMTVVDVSTKGDWSAVRVESTPGAMGRVYPITGFIYAGAGSEG